MISNIYQVKEGLTRKYAFMSFNYIQTVFGGIDMNNYNKVAEVEIPNNIEDKDTVHVLSYIFTYGNTDENYYADNPQARSISVSDVIEYKNKFYYTDTVGFVEIEDSDFISDKEITESKSALQEDDAPYIEDDGMGDNDKEADTENDKDLIDFLQDRIGQQITVAELNTILQSLFSRYNDIFLLESDIYNADLDEPQTLSIWDDDDEYIITYDIIDVAKGIIEITDVNVN